MEQYHGTTILSVRRGSSVAMGGDGQGVFAGTGGQSVDTGATSIMHTDFSQSGLSSIDTDEGVDPVAEADVYMAYGRDVQAEEILQDALKADPARAAIYVKLLEIYAQRRNSRQFEATASELFARTGGLGRDWDKAAALGRKLDPDNPLYGAAPAQPATSVAPAAGADVLAMAGVAAGAATGLAAAPAVAVSTVSTAPGTQAGIQAATEAARGADAIRHELSSLDFTTTTPVEPSHSQMRDTWTLPGDLSRIGSEGREPGMPEHGLEEPAVEHVADGFAIDSGVIDFDLDLGDEMPASEPSVEPAQADEQAFDLDFAAEAAAVPVDGQAETGMVFDLDIGEPDAAPATPAADLGSATVLDDVGQMVATGLDFELPDLELDSSGDRFDLNATVVSDSALPFDLGDAGSSAGLTPATAAAGDTAAPLAAPEQPVVDLEKTSFDSSLLEFDFELDAPAAPDTAPPVTTPGLELTSIDLDLEGFQDNAVPEVDVVPLSMAETQFDDFPGLHASAPAAEMMAGEVDNEEAETKLELARAYEEMGDKEGALELLEEVAAEGSARQQTTARDMIARLG